MEEPRGFDELFNAPAVRVALSQGRQARPRNLPASASEMRGRTSYTFGMEDASMLHSQRSLAASCARRAPSSVSVSGLRGRTSYKERGAAFGGLGSFVDRYLPSLAPAPPSRAARPAGPAPVQPASVTKMRLHTSMLERGL